MESRPGADPGGLRATRPAGGGWDANLADQARRAAISTMANIAEGFDAGTNAEFRRFLRIAFRSATELQSHLHVALDAEFVDRATFDRLYIMAKDTKGLLGGFMRYLSSRRARKPCGHPSTKNPGERPTGP